VELEELPARWSELDSARRVALRRAVAGTASRARSQLGAREAKGFKRSIQLSRMLGDEFAGAHSASEQEMAAATAAAERGIILGLLLLRHKAPPRPKSIAMS